MESHPLVYIRTDGNETIATGHLMRCLSIARALKKRGAAVAFLVSDDTSASILQKMYSPDEIADHSFPILLMWFGFGSPVPLSRLIDS